MRPEERDPAEICRAVGLNLRLFKEGMADNTQMIYNA